MAVYEDVEHAVQVLRDEFSGGRFTLRRWCRFLENASVRSAPDFDFKDKSALLLYALDLLPMARGACPVCHGIIDYGTEAGKTLGISCRCLCPSRDVLANSVWRRLQIEHYVPCMFLFVCGYDLGNLRAEFDLYERTISDWVTQWQELMADQVVHQEWPMGRQVGGPGVVVQVDESFINKGKPATSPFHCARHERRTARWVWGAVGEDGLGTGDVYITLLPEDVSSPRGAPYLRSLLLALVAPGSIVVHDDWGAYRAIDWDKLPFQHEPCCVVNHSKEIINIYGFHTNRIEAVWGVLKQWLRKRFHGRLPRDRDGVELAVYEFLWRKKTADTSFEVWVELLRSLQGPEP